MSKVVGKSIKGKPFIDVPIEDGDWTDSYWTGYLSGQECMVVMVGKRCGNGPVLYFPNIYLLNFDAGTCVFMTNMFKFGIDGVKTRHDQKPNLDGDPSNNEVCLHGYCGGQSVQWERFSVDGGYIGIHDED